MIGLVENGVAHWLVITHERGGDETGVSRGRVGDDGVDISTYGRPLASEWGCAETVPNRRIRVG